MEEWSLPVEDELEITSEQTLALVGNKLYIHNYKNGH